MNKLKFLISKTNHNLMTYKLTYKGNISHLHLYSQVRQSWEHHQKLGMQLPCYVHH